MLPPPLSREEEAKAISAMGSGNEQAKSTLIEHNLRLVVYIARRFESTGINLEDLISIGTIGLIKAVNTFRPEKNIKLATYASRCIENEILMYLRKIASQPVGCLPGRTHQHRLGRQRIKAGGRIGHGTGRSVPAIGG